MVVELRALTRQYQVPLPRVAVQLVPDIQFEDVFIVENEELLLTCTRYWTEPPPGLTDAFHLSPIGQPEYEEQELRPFAISSGADGAEPDGVADKVKELAADHADTSEVSTASRACTRQYQVPVPRVGVQVVPVIHPDEALIVAKDELLLTCTEYWVDPPPVPVTAFHCSETGQEPEQTALGSATRVGAVMPGESAPAVQGVTAFQYWLVFEPVFPSWQVLKLLLTGPVPLLLPPSLSSSSLRPE